MHQSIPATNEIALVRSGSKRTLLQVLKDARERIQVNDDELDEARRRRDLLAGTLKSEFGADSRTYVNGSIAHGDALTPLTDIDLGVVVPNSDGSYGPYGRGPAELQERAAAAIRTAHKEEFPNLRVFVGGRKRSVYVSFGDPVDPNVADFSADVIVALDCWTGSGLWIPHYDNWDRSDPESHTGLVRDAAKRSEYNYSRTVRLLKHWARRHSKPLCSWNIKALGLDSLTDSMNQLDGMLAWFDYAIGDLSWRETPDPADVAGAISIPGDRAELVTKLSKARDKLADAISFEKDGYHVLAVEALASFFNDKDMLPPPETKAVTAQQLQRTADMRAARTSRVTVGDRPQTRNRTPTRSWAP
ncbi:hypothetical protein A2J03_26240 [Rhodococcus sp. EPR-157]|uniref:hypothetical protein n=1 Tax=Rhodococcus sp. EPR-157 TaxID=1813677 RepID=UPI0007BBDCE0|nr:hypothetical protein [Rhodococcus sp. EPR-157]KZF04496.1 hypothetical protein A2J03_26240 [Rhodococcus sp. EPR-157]